MMGTRIALAAGLALLMTQAGAWELLEPREEPESWGYRPSNVVAGLNPPGFTWGPEPSASTYELQVARDDAFEQIAYASEGLPWFAHCPPEALDPGAYFWRYRGINAKGEPSAWSGVRTFTIDESATVFPKPTMAELAARVPAEHPRLFFRPEDIPQYRAMAQGKLAGRMENLIEAADRLLEDPPPTEEPPLYPEGTVRKSEAWKEIWWGNRRKTIAVTDGAASLAFVYRMTGDERYGQAARDLLMAFAEWDPDGSTNYQYNDEAGMPALYFPARAYTWAYPMLSEADRAKLIAVMRERGEDCFRHLRGRQHLWKPYASHSNRAWHFLGELAIAFIDDIPEAPLWLDYATTIFYTCYPVWSGPDGGWHEGILYWASYMNRFGYWILASRSAFGIDVFERPYFSKAGYYGMYVAPPGTEHGGFADQAYNNAASRAASTVRMLALGSKNPHWQWYADQENASIGGYVGFCFAAGAPDLEAQAPSGLPDSKLFSGVGIAALNTTIMHAEDNVQLFFKSSPMGSISHGFNANNAFHLNVGGQAVLVNTGRRDVHGSPHHQEWMWQTKSQNAILVNGEGQRGHSPRDIGEITAFFTSESLDAVVGEAGESYRNLYRWRRAIVFLKPDTFVIDDWLEAPEPSTYQWLLHNHDGPFEIGENRATCTGPGAEVAVTWLMPSSLDITQTGEYDTPPHEWANFDLNQHHLTAATQDAAASQHFITVIQVNTEAPAALEEDGGAKTLSLSNGSVTWHGDGSITAEKAGSSWTLDANL